MKACGIIRYKSFFSSKSGLEASVPVIGSLLLLLILFALVGATVISFFNIFGDGANFQPSVAKISLESCEGGLYGVGPMDERVTLEENRIVLMHEGGSSLPFDSISIRISGYGNSYQGIADGSGKSIVGNTEVIYHNLSPEGKNPKYLTQNNAVLEDGIWEVGEKLILCGQDSSVKSIDSSVKVSVNGVGNTSDNYGFKAGTEITLKVVDSKGRNVLAEQKATVKLAD